MTLRDLYAIQKSIGSLLSAELDVRVSYRLRHWIRNVREEMRDAEEARMKLIRKHSPTGPLQQGTPTFLQFEAEWEEMLESTVELPEVHVTIDELEAAHVVCEEPSGASSKRKLLAGEIADLEFLITDNPSDGTSTKH